VSLIATLLGNPMLATVAMFPVALVIVAMFFTSIYFTFQDIFDATSPKDSENASPAESAGGPDGPTSSDKQ